MASLMDHLKWLTTIKFLLQMKMYGILHWNEHEWTDKARIYMELFGQQSHDPADRYPVIGENFCFPLKLLSKFGLLAFAFQPVNQNHQ